VKLIQRKAKGVEMSHKIIPEGRLAVGLLFPEHWAGFENSRSAMLAHREAVKD
jgi:hypothetical protein